MKRLLAMSAWFLLAAAAPPAVTGPVMLCPDAGAARNCRPVDLSEVRLSEPETRLVRTVRVDPSAMPLARPPMIWLIAMASAEVRWNGVLVGRNGVPGPDAASEIPGRFVATFVVPPQLVRPGDNLVSVRMSAHHLWLPVRRPVHLFEISPYETPALPGLTDYLPTLLALGALAGAFSYFAAAAVLDRRDGERRLLALIAGAAMLQLVIEVIRTFVAYPYPWHLARVATIALLAAITAVLVAAYAAGRFAPRWRKAAALATGILAAASVLLLPWFDIKAMGAILAGALALGACAARGRRDRRRGAAAGLASAAACVALMVWQKTAFLDRAYYLLLATVLVALVAEQVSNALRLRSERDLETARAAALAERLARAERRGEAIVQLKDGTRIHRVAEGDILWIRAADDYCDVRLADGRFLLVTQTLARLLASLPARFGRVHKSHAVNRPHVVRVVARPGGGRELILSDGSKVPVGRSYAPVVAAWLG
jgi:DNA-binding LytR/AlgR family response regulator